MAVNEITFLRRMIYTYKNPQNDEGFLQSKKTFEQSTQAVRNNRYINNSKFNKITMESTQMQ